MDITLPITLTTPGSTVHTPFGDTTVGETSAVYTLTIHNAEQLLAAQTPALLSAQQLVDTGYTSAELFAALQLALKAGK